MPCHRGHILLEAREPKVGDLGDAARGEQNVLRLEVAMDDHGLLAVQVVAALRHVHRDLEQPRKGQHQPLTVHRLMQRAAVHVLHHHA